jgi:hypothetical protein
MTLPFTVEVLDKLRWNAHLGKHKHFAAAGSGRKSHVWFGVPVIAINVVLGSTLFASLGTSGIDSYVKWAGAVFALLAALLGSLQTFFNFEKLHVEHRAVGNEYLTIARECERLLALHLDGLLPLAELSTNIERVNLEYVKVNQRSEALTVSPKHFAAALKTQQKKKAEELSLVQRYSNQNGN